MPRWPQLGERDFIVMASDGLWDVITSQEAVAIVTQELVKSGWSPDVNLSVISQRLCTESFRRGSMDNITVVIIMCVSQSGGEDQVSAPSKARMGMGSGRNLVRANGYGSYAGDSLSHAGSYEPPSPANRLPLGAVRGENTIAADLWGGGAVGRLGPGKAQRDSLGAGGNVTKTLLPAGYATHKKRTAREARPLPIAMVFSLTAACAHRAAPCLLSCFPWHRTRSLRSDSTVHTIASSVHLMSPSLTGKMMRVSLGNAECSGLIMYRLPVQGLGRIMMALDAF